jgi:hypothetical protein
VTAFFVDSFSKLQPDDAATTNSLLSNLTNIFLLVHDVSFNETGLPLALPFEPNRNDVRENVFWSISLALSVSNLLLAALIPLLRVNIVICCCVSRCIPITRHLSDPNKDPRSLQSGHGDIPPLAKRREISITYDRLAPSASHHFHWPICHRSYRQPLFGLSFARWIAIAISLYGIESLLCRVRDVCFHLGVYNSACDILATSFPLCFYPN